MILRLLDSYTDPDVELYNEIFDRLIKGANFIIEDADEFDYILNLEHNKNNKIEESFGSHFRHKIKKESIEHNFFPNFLPPLLRAGDIVFFKKFSGNRVFLKLIDPSESRPQENQYSMQTDYLGYQSAFIEALQEYIDHQNHADISRITPYIYSLYQHWGLFKDGDLSSFNNKKSSSGILDAHDRSIILEGFKTLQDQIATKGFPTRNIKVIECLYMEEYPFSIEQLEKYIHTLYQKQFDRFSLDLIPLR